MHLCIALVLERLIGCQLVCEFSTSSALATNSIVFIQLFDSAENCWSSFSFSLEDLRVRQSVTALFALLGLPGRSAPIGFRVIHLRGCGGDEVHQQDCEAGGNRNRKHPHDELERVHEIFLKLSSFPV